jgi:hypothetical protein
MIAFKRIVTVEDPDRVVLSGLPFRPGQRVEIVMLAEEDQPEARVAELKRLLRACQDIPAAVTVSEEEIADEIAAYRAGR